MAITYFFRTLTRHTFLRSVQVLTRHLLRMLAGGAGITLGITLAGFLSAVLVRSVSRSISIRSSRTSRVTPDSHSSPRRSLVERLPSSRSLLLLCTSFTLFGAMSYAVPSVALADVLDLSGTREITLVNVPIASYVANNPSAYLQGSSESFSLGNFIKLQETSYSSSHLVVTGTSTSSESLNESSSGSGTDSISLVGTESGYSDGTIDAQYPNPDAGPWLGDYASFEGDVDSSYSGQSTLNGEASSTFRFTTLGSITGTGTSSSNGYEDGRTVRCIEARPSNGFNLSGLSGSVFLVTRFSGFAYFPDRTPLLFSGLNYNFIIFHRDSGTDVFLPITGYGNVFVTNSSKSKTSGIVNRSTSGRFFPDIDNFSDIYSMISFSGSVPSGQFDSIILGSDPKVFRDLGYENTETLSSVLNGQTTSINSTIEQQSQNQTNQLKDTSGADSVLGAPKQIGDDIYQRVTFANQVAQLSGAFATTVANADMSEAGFEFPGFTWQDTVIWETQMISPWRDIPVDIKSKIRLFNTMIFAIVWFRSLWNWIASIFGFETEKDTVEYQSNMFSNNSNFDHPPDDSYF